VVIFPKFKSWWVLWIYVNLWLHHAPIWTHHLLTLVYIILMRLWVQVEVFIVITFLNSLHTPHVLMHGIRSMHKVFNIFYNVLYWKVYLISLWQVFQSTSRMRFFLNHFYLQKPTLTLHKRMMICLVMGVTRASHVSIHNLSLYNFSV
jgi:hypothetical protein